MYYIYEYMYILETNTTINRGNISNTLKVSLNTFVMSLSSPSLCPKTTTDLISLTIDYFAFRQP